MLILDTSYLLKKYLVQELLG